MPLIVDFARTRANVLDSRLAFWISILASVLAGILISIASGDVGVSFESILLNLGVVFTSSQIVYKQYWETSEAREKFVTNLRPPQDIHDCDENCTHEKEPESLSS